MYGYSVAHPPAPYIFQGCYHRVEDESNQESAYGSVS